MSKVIGYKASEDGVCRGLRYEVGQTYEMKSRVVVCHCGYHYCRDIDDVFEYYPYKNGVTKIFEIEDLGTQSVSDVDKTATNKIKIIREIPFEEWNSLMVRHKFNDKGIKIYTKTSGLFWRSVNFDDDGNPIRYVDYDGYWCNSTYDHRGYRIKSENSFGHVETWEYDNGGWIINHKVSTNR